MYVQAMAAAMKEWDSGWSEMTCREVMERQAERLAFNILMLENMVRPELCTYVHTI